MNPLFRFLRDKRAAFNLSMNPIMGIISIVLGSVVTLMVLAELAPTFFDSLGALAGVFTNTSYTTGSTVGDALKPVFAILISLGGLAAIVALAMKAFTIRKA